MKDDFSSTNAKEVLELLVDDVRAESARTLSRFKAIAPGIIIEWRSGTRQFETQLGQMWNRPFLLMESFLRISMEMGAKYSLAEPADYLYQALTGLHGRACRIGREVLVLLKSGYPVGAFARWRAIHEIAITSHLIRENGNDLAKRYLDHEVAERLASMRVNQQYHEILEMDPYSEEEISSANKAQDSLIAKYGKEFMGDYGWATTILNGRPANFKELEKLAGLDHYRPFYRMASDGIHAGSRVIRSHLGMRTESPSDVILVGPSSRGIALPGQSTVISLMQVNHSILPRHPGAEDVILMDSLYRLMMDTRDALETVEAKIESSSKDGALELGGPIFGFIKAPDSSFRPHSEERP